ncbi:hypothetical protein EMIHUDRAFT_217038 [Emiliania huxleyi CCMP1516]|uniref:Uncharacterized protein n=2 Tax=Emiliania huxleyi TaxID=2903 RepID=A0A0D3IC01_EMIH1|nr:hypothetical protein EMIHUDRAFT_217038 [Emiliania huxleyi CCMP1516]EOD08786.1 hypothetical protein EMIHUDRAFT_217038 [Emiliania huxleyi CCMP1516]|eukprot:XP_005761215.1 hypothetical protein EMIHUDRAFT_217038 [Emiliania huxleyi CCMP1516]
MQADSTHMRSALQCVEAVAGVARPVAVEALVSGACARLVARVPQMAPGAAEALLCEVVGAGALSDEALAPAAHALIEHAPSVPAVVIEAAAVGGAVLLASLPVGAKRRIIEAAPERFIHQLFPLLMEYIAPTRHTRVLSDVLGLSRQLPAERRSAIAPLSALLSLAPVYQELLKLSHDVYKNTLDVFIAMLRCDADRKLLRQVLSYLAAQGLPPVADLPAQRSRLADAAMVLAAWPVAQQLARTVMQRLEALLCALAQLLLLPTHAVSLLGSGRLAPEKWEMEAAVPLDSQIDSIRSLVSLVVGRPALLTPALSGALLLGFLLPAATRSHAVHSRLLVLLEKCAQHFRYAQPTSVLASLDRSASAEGRRRSLLAEALCRARDEGQRGDEADYFEREYARLALVLPELASEQG